MEDDMSSPLIHDLAHGRQRLRSNSECDVVNEAGHYSIASDIVSTDNDGVAQRWDLNYREAAIFLQEGENNDKFTAHPRHEVDLPAYMIAHSTSFHLLSLLSSIMLLLLAIIEPPALAGVTIPIPVHASMELLGLLVITLELFMKLKWLGVRMFVRHIRTMIKVVVLVIMFIEAITVMIRQESHFRVTRALRPLFLLDAHYCRGVRRFIRQIIQSMPPIIDMLVLLVFFIMLFSMLGFYLFSSMPNDTYFQDIVQSFLSLFVLLTSSNFPDVMMPAYKSNKWSAVFFVVYISIELFLFMNLFLAVVYSAFINIEKEKLRKLLLHRRRACSWAFKLLVTSQNPNAISVRHFAQCLRYFRPRMSRRDVYLTFKLLNVSKTGMLSEEEFASIYEVVSLKWQPRCEDHWSVRLPSPWKQIVQGLFRVVSSKWFDYIVYVVISANFIWICVDVIRLSVLKSRTTDPNFSWVSEEQRFLWCSILFVVIYIVEAALKILGFGPTKYFSSGWNIFDFVVTAIALLGLLLQLVSSSFHYIVLLRPLRVLRLFKLKRRFRDVFGTLFILFSQMVSLSVAMLLLYYFFAIIGMELFATSTPLLMNCCRNTSVEQYYMYDNVTGLDGYYYLNTFENILSSGVTLFELTIVNNWWIIMEGFAFVTSGWTRIYFMIFYLIIMIVMAVIVSFILEAFIFRIQYRMMTTNQHINSHSMKKIDVPLSEIELQMAANSSQTPLTGRYIAARDIQDANDGVSHEIWFCGKKFLSKTDFCMRMYHREVKVWIAEYDTGSRQNSAATLLAHELDNQASLVDTVVDTGPNVSNTAVMV